MLIASRIVMGIALYAIMAYFVGQSYPGSSRRNFLHKILDGSVVIVAFIVSIIWIMFLFIFFGEAMYYVSTGGIFIPFPWR